MENCNRAKMQGFTKVGNQKWKISIFWALALLMVSIPIFAQSSALNALKTDGVDDYAYPLSPNAAGISEGTVELWFSPDNWTTSEQMWGGGNGLPGVNGDWARLGTHSSAGSNNLAFGRFSGGWQWASSGTQPDSANWSHVAATWGPTGLQIYINGSLTGQNGFTGNLNTYATELIATSSWGDFFDGAIDELRIWDFAMDSAAIARTLLDTLGSEYYSTADSGLIAYYRMDLLEDLGINSDGVDDLRDLSVNANHLDTDGGPTLEPSGAFVITGIENVAKEIPTGYVLNLNYPNPFNPTTSIKYKIPQKSFVTLAVFNILGQKVAALVNEEKQAGAYQVQFDGSALGSGVYYYGIEAEGFVQTRKMLLVR